MPKTPIQTDAEDILKERIEGYKTNPDKYKKHLVFVAYQAWCNMVPKSEECKKYPLTFLCDFDVNSTIEWLVNGKRETKNKHRFNFLGTILTEAKKYYDTEEYFLSLVLYATYIEHWFNDLINCLAITKNLDDSATEKLIKMFTNDSRLDLLWPLFDLPEIDEKVKKDIKMIFDTRNYFIHYKWKPKNDKEGISQIEKFMVYTEKAPEIIEYLNEYVEENIYNKEFLEKFFANLIYKQSGITIEEEYKK